VFCEGVRADEGLARRTLGPAEAGHYVRVTESRRVRLPGGPVVYAALSERVCVFLQRMTAETIVPSTAITINPMTTIRN